MLFFSEASDFSVSSVVSRSYEKSWIYQSGLS
jgi:hypothetical protein